MAILLEEFYQNNAGDTVANPDGSWAGQCVSLVQQYLYQVLNFDFHPRGNAKEWIDTLKAEGIAYEVTSPQKGDIVVCPTKAAPNGHIGIFIDDLDSQKGSNMMFEQNYGNDDDPNKQTSRAARTFDKFIKNEYNVQVEYHILRPYGPGLTNTLEGIYLVAKNGSFNVRSYQGNFPVLDNVPKGSEAKILGFKSDFIAASDGSYQWAFVEYEDEQGNVVQGYSQLDLKGDYLIRKTVGSDRIYMRAVNDSFYVRTAVVTGASMALVSIGNRAEILTVGNGFESDTYQWAQTSYNGCTGWSQMDTVGNYRLEK